MATFKIDNQPTLLTMNDFRSQSSRQGGLAKSCKFAVQILPSGTSSFLTSAGYGGDFMGQFTYLCESAEFPGRGFNMADMRYYGPSFKVPYQADYQETAMTFLCRNESIERQFFDDWMEIINPTDTFDFAYKDDYKCQINMFQFSDVERNSSKTEPVATYVWTLHDAWPVLVSPQPVTWADDNFQRLAISFSYTKWTRPNKDKKSGTFKLVEDAIMVDPITAGGPI